MIKRLAELDEAVQRYHREERHPERPVIVRSGVYDLYPEIPLGRALQLPTAGCWPQSFPHSDKPGVYAVADEKLEVLYYGKADAIGARLCRHFPARNRETYSVSQWGGSSPRFVVVYPVQGRWEATSLEAYLLAWWKPPANVRTS